MQPTIIKNLQKIAGALQNIGNFPRSIIKYGSQAFLALFALGTILFALNQTSFNSDSYQQLIATALIKNSFIIFAEVIIGGLLMEYFFSKG